jgi:diphthamide biosynthesis protein 3
MAVFHDEVEIEDFEFDEETQSYYYPCPCGDQFQISKEDLENGEEIAECPSCSLIVRVIYDPVSDPECMEGAAYVLSPLLHRGISSPRRMCRAPDS